MNNLWSKFLNDQHLNNDSLDGEACEKKNTFSILTHFSLLKISGNDAETFLQGQITCNVKELTNTNSFFSAFCNAKGRVIATFLIYKDNEDYLLIVPTVLVEKVVNKLKMYVLRAAVNIVDISDQYCITGLTIVQPSDSFSFPDARFDVKDNLIKVSSEQNRYLLITKNDQSEDWWTKIYKNNGLPCNESLWKFDDQLSGLPWLNLDCSEQFIPQMLNIDQLGGISFNKGCYTGQEVVARTHYLGKAKRKMFLAECHSDAMLDRETQVYSEQSEQPVGEILSAHTFGKNTRMLIVLKSLDLGYDTLYINTPIQTTIKLVDFNS